MQSRSSFQRNCFFRHSPVAVKRKEEVREALTVAVFKTRLGSLIKKKTRENFWMKNIKDRFTWGRLGEVVGRTKRRERPVPRRVLPERPLIEWTCADTGPPPKVSITNFRSIGSRLSRLWSGTRQKEKNHNQVRKCCSNKHSCDTMAQPATGLNCIRLRRCH